MSLNNKKRIVSIIFLCSLLSACNTEYIYKRNKPDSNYYEKNNRIIERKYEKNMCKNIKKHAKAEKIESDLYQLEIQSVDYEMDSIEQLHNSIIDTFTVKKIYKGNGVYEILLLSKKNGKDYEIYSTREKYKKNEKIKVGQTYRMTIVPYFKETSTRPIEIIRPVYLNGYRIMPFPLHFGQVYSTDNLKGLYYYPE